MKTHEIYSYINAFAPFDTALSYDNPGLLVGSPNSEVTNILVALDITNDVISEAVKLGAELIVSHHPVIFDPIKSLDTLSPVYLLAKNGIAAICAHTNLDAAKGGVNDVLAEALELKDTSVWQPENIGRIGVTDKKTLIDFALFVKHKLNAETITVVDGNRSVNKVAVMGGSGGGDIDFALDAGADTLVTGEMKHSQFIEAKNKGLNIVAAGHFETENIIVPVLAEQLRKSFPQIHVHINTQKPYRSL